ncbi:MAG: YibE/F family protein [Armatimonadetes bacterium]|nr:YibE/F family protein [Armatimonadota bacterium]
MRFLRPAFRGAEGKDLFFAGFIGAACIFLFFFPAGFSNPHPQGTCRAQGLILEVDNSHVQKMGLVNTGAQGLKVKILSGPFKGRTVNAVNHFKGILEFDKVFQENDRALIVVDYAGDEILHVNTIDHYRLPQEAVLFFLFLAILLAFAGWTGVKAALSFLFTVLVIWKILLPGFLKGLDPVFLALGVVTLLVFCICFLVAGLSLRGVTAFAGALSGIFLACLLAVLFGKGFKLHGAVLPFTETLLYSGYGHLDITRIFFASVFIACSGAVTDVSVDVAASIAEVVSKKPGISTREAVSSGLSVARAVVGTMATTLLLAYSGSYLGLLMVFIAQGTPVTNILNLNYVAAELMHTLVGSFGLVVVGPLTAVIGGFLFTRPRGPGGAGNSH